MSEETQINEVLLRKKEGSIKFKGYSCLAQIGRYFSLTLANRVTRLYTLAGFLNNQNSCLLR